MLQVHYFDVLVNYAGTPRADVCVAAETTVRGLPEHWIEFNAELFRRALATGDALRTYLCVFRSSQLVTTDARDALVAQDDEIILFLADAGG